MRINTSMNTPINVNGEPLDSVNDFIYLGSLISEDNGAQKDIKARLGNAQGVFVRLRPIWKSTQYKLKSKIPLCNSNVKSVYCMDQNACESSNLM